MKILWIDLETTGLDPTVSGILEVAAIIDRNGTKKTVIDQFVHNLVGLDGRVGWDRPAFEMHRKSGLLLDYHSHNVVCSMNGDRLLTVSNVEDMLLKDILEDDETVYLGGSSVHFDRTFIEQYMPTLHETLHYRHIDVSCLTTFLQHAGMAKTEHEKQHRAMADIQYSIATYYKYLDLARDWIRNDGLDNS